MEEGGGGGEGEEGKEGGGVKARKENMGWIFWGNG